MFSFGAAFETASNVLLAPSGAQAQACCKNVRFPASGKYACLHVLCKLCLI